MRTLAIPIAVLVMMTGCTPPPQPTRIVLTSDQILRISPAVWADYLLYLGKLNILGTGAYVVSDTGIGGGYVLCDSPLPYNCYSREYYVDRALRLCEREGSKCVVFSEGETILVDYEIAE